MRMGQQVMTSGIHNALPLAPVDAFFSAAPSIAAAVTNFDKYYCIGIAHDQIQLTQPAAVIACEQTQARLLQQTASLAFAQLAECMTGHGSVDGAKASVADNAPVQLSADASVFRQ